MEIGRQQGHGDHASDQPRLSADRAGHQHSEPQKQDDCRQPDCCEADSQGAERDPLQQLKRRLHDGPVDVARQIPIAELPVADRRVGVPAFVRHRSPGLRELNGKVRFEMEEPRERCNQHQDHTQKKQSANRAVASRRTHSRLQIFQLVRVNLDP